LLRVSGERIVGLRFEKSLHVPFATVIRFL
jgi:hypothetical protein